MHELEFKFAQGVVRARWWIIALSLVLVALASIGVQHLTYTNSYRVFFGSDDPLSPFNSGIYINMCMMAPVQQYLTDYTRGFLPDTSTRVPGGTAEEDVTGPHARAMTERVCPARDTMQIHNVMRTKVIAVSGDSSCLELASVLDEGRIS